MNDVCLIKVSFFESKHAWSPQIGEIRLIDATGLYSTCEYLISFFWLLFIDFLLILSHLSFSLSFFFFSFSLFFFSLFLLEIII